jgi:hypothetical protein
MLPIAILVIGVLTGLVLIALTAVLLATLARLLGLLAGLLLIALAAVLLAALARLLRLLTGFLAALLAARVGVLRVLGHVPSP